MAANDSELQKLLLSYISTEGEGRERMRQVLQTTSVGVRYRTLIDVRGAYQETAVHSGAWFGDLDSLKCMMSGFTSDQLYNIVKMQSNSNQTPLHLAAGKGHTDITKFLLSKLSQEQRFNILKIQDIFVSTPLHKAAYNNHTADLLDMLTSVSADQRERLLNIRGPLRKTIAAITPLPKLPYDVAGWTKIELDVTNQKLAEVEKQCREQGDVIGQLVVDLAEQRDGNARQAQELDVTNQKLAEVEKQCSEQGDVIGQLVVDLAKQREDNARQAQELRNLVDRLENMI